MPIYEYQCSACGHQLEIVQKMSDPLLTECPQCKQKSLQKLVSAAGFQLKGTGWYVTDFKNKNKSDPTAKTDSGKSDTGTASSNSTDTSSKADKT